MTMLLERWPCPSGTRLHPSSWWAAVAEADHYVVRRATQFDFSNAVDVGTTSGTVLEDVNAALTPEAYIYGVFAVNACGQE